MGSDLPIQADAAEAAALLDALEAEGRRAYLDPGRRDVFRVSGERLPPEREAELRRLKPAILALLRAEALAREAGTPEDPFADGAGPEAPPWRMPDGSLMAHSTRLALLAMGEFVLGQRRAGGTPADRRIARARGEKAEGGKAAGAALPWDTPAG